MDHQDRNVVTEDRLEFERRMERNTSSECRAEGWRIPAAMMFVLVTARYFHTDHQLTTVTGYWASCSKPEMMETQTHTHNLLEPKSPQNLRDPGMLG